MRRLIVGLLFLLFSVWLALQVIHHPGYLFIVLSPWTVQMPIWFAVLVVFVLFGFFYLLMSSIDKLHFLYFRLKNWRQLRREHQFYSKTQQGLAMLIEERWHKAERLLLSGVSDSIDPLMNYLGAARAADAQGAFERRNTYIQKAYQVAPGANLAIGLTQAELEISDNQLEQAVGTLSHLKQIVPRHPRVLSLLEKVYVRLADWKKLEALLPALRKANVMTLPNMEIFEKNIYVELLQGSVRQLDELHCLWKSIPKQMKKNPQVVFAYVNCLLSLNNAERTTVEIEDVIRQTLKNHWHKGLVNIYGSLQFANVNRQLVIVGAWLKLHGQQPELLLALGRLCMCIQLWGKAKDYFEKSLALSQNPMIFLEYGRLLEQLDEPLVAMEKYRAGLILCQLD